MSMKKTAVKVTIGGSEQEVYFESVKEILSDKSGPWSKSVMEIDEWKKRYTGLMEKLTFDQLKVCYEELRKCLPGHPLVGVAGEFKVAEMSEVPFGEDNVGNKHSLIERLVLIDFEAPLVIARGGNLVEGAGLGWLLQTGRLLGRFGEWNSVQTVSEDLSKLAGSPMVTQQEFERALAMMGTGGLIREERESQGSWGEWIAVAMRDAAKKKSRQKSLESANGSSSLGAWESDD